MKWASQLKASGCILLNPALNYYGEPPTWEPSFDAVVDPKFAVDFFTDDRKGMTVIYETGGHRMEGTEDMLVEIEEAIYSHRV